MTLFSTITIIIIWAVACPAIILSGSKLAKCHHAKKGGWIGFDELLETRGADELIADIKR